MANAETSQLAEVIAQLKSLNLSGEVIMDAMDDNNKLVTRSLLIGSQAEGERVDNGGQLLAVVTSLRRMVSDISRSNKELLEFFTSNDMQQEENRKDLLAALRERDKESTKPKEKTKKGKKDSESGLAGILVFAAGLIGGTVVGFVSEAAAMFGALIRDGKIYKSISLAVTKIGNILKGFGQYISGIAKVASKFLANTKIGTGVIKGFNTISSAVTKIGTGIIKGFNTIRTILSLLFTGVQLIGEGLAGLAMESALVKSVTNTISQIANAWARFTGALRAVGDMIRPLFGTAEEGLKIGARLSKIFPNIAKFFTALGDILGGFARGFKTGVSIGKAIARLLPAIFGLLKAVALPLTIAIALYETVMGAIEGFKTDGILGAVKGAISGLLIGLVGGLVDLVKDIVSWIANKLGFENFSKFLDSFSFSQLLKDGVDAIFDTVTYAFDWFKSIFSFEKFSKAFENFGIAGLLSVFYGGILDTAKGVVSWIATMFGALDISIALDNFSFTDSINKGLEMVFALPAKIWNWITNMFSWKTISGMFEDFSVTGLWSGLYGGILDTVKGAISWMAALFGFDTISKYLDSFSFADMFKTVFDAIGEAIDGVIDWIMNIPTLISELVGQMGQAIDGALSGVGNLAEGFAKGVLRDVLPDPAATGVLNPMSWVAKAIPDSIYEYAGLKAAGKEADKATPAAGGSAPMTGAQSLTDGEKSSKAKEAGYESWNDYEKSGWKYKTSTHADAASALTPAAASALTPAAASALTPASITNTANTTGAQLMSSGSSISVSPVIVNNYGGNISNTTQSSVNNTNSSYDPIMTGSAMGFASV